MPVSYRTAMLTPSTDFLKLTVYVAFFSVLLGFYGLPLHIMRDLFLSFRSFFKRIADFVRYRNATRDMNARYPDATAEEVGREEVCIICREEMRPVIQNNNADGTPQRVNPVAERMRPKKLPCGHILHFSCLRSWLERQQNCPTCRRPVVVTQRMQVQANGQPLPGNAAGQLGGAALPGHMPDQPVRNRARVINFGPLRLGFGAGGGNLMDDLAQRIHDGEQRPPAEAAGNADGQQHFGFGFGLGRRAHNRNRSTTAVSTAPIQVQLEQIERGLQQQIHSLRVASSELHVVRMLNNELLRLRNLQATRASNEAAIPQVPDAASAPSIPGLSQGQLPLAAHQPPPTILSSHSQHVLTSDSDALPEGVTLPPGWTLMPLQRADGPHRTVMNGVSGATNHPPNVPMPSVSQAPHTSTHYTPRSRSSDAVLPSSSSPGPASNTTNHVAAPEVRPSTSPQPSPSFPAMGSAARQANGENSADQGRNASPVRNGQERLGSAAASENTGQNGPEKGKGKAATVEDLVDDVD